jgi:putative phosphoribosyl transferase
MIDRRPIFTDRHDAGRELARALAHYAAQDPVVLALPRGGVPVAYEVARALGAPLDLAMVRKIGAPGHPELGLGAVVDGAEPQVVMNASVEEIVGPSAEYVEQQTRRELLEIQRRRKAYLGDRPAIPIRDRTVIVVDDGVATGGTVRAVLQALSKSKARRIVLATPVGPMDTIESLRTQADDVVCLATPEPFYAVGLWYGDFTQTTDKEVIACLEAVGGKTRAQAVEEKRDTASPTAR